MVKGNESTVACTLNKDDNKLNKDNKTLFGWYEEEFPLTAMWVLAHARTKISHIQGGKPACCRPWLYVVTAI